MADTFTIGAHPSDPQLVVYSYLKDGRTIWTTNLPANDWQSQINRSFPVTDLRDNTSKSWAPNAIQRAEANGIALRSKAHQALTSNAAFLAIQSPSAAQNAAQIKALTRQVNGLIRLSLNELDTITDT